MARKPYFPARLTNFLSWQRFWVGGKDSYLFTICVAAFGVILIVINVNKMNKEWAKGVKFYLRLIIEGKQINCVYFLLGGLLSLFLALLVLAGLSWSFLFQKGSSAWGKQVMVRRQHMRRKKKITMSLKYLQPAACWGCRRGSAPLYCKFLNSHWAKSWSYHWSVYHPDGLENNKADL